jgi:hypothetical protein
VLLIVRRLFVPSDSQRSRVAQVGENKKNRNFDQYRVYSLIVRLTQELKSRRIEHTVLVITMFARRCAVATVSLMLLLSSKLESDREIDGEYESNRECETSP